MNPSEVKSLSETQEERNMILAGKIIEERKKLGLSREELAEKLSY